MICPKPEAEVGIVALLRSEAVNQREFDIGPPLAPFVKELGQPVDHIYAEPILLAKYLVGLVVYLLASME